MTTAETISLLSPIALAVFGGLVRRSLRLQDQAQADRDDVERTRHEAIEKLLKEQRASLESEIRATRSDVRLVVGDVSEHGKLLAGAAASLDALSARLHDQEDEVRKLVREGCAHRQVCKR